MTELELKQRAKKFNKAKRNSLTIRITLNKFGFNLNTTNYGKPSANTYSGSYNIWGKDSNGDYCEDEAVADLKAKVCAMIDEQRKIIVNDLNEAGLYEPADV